MQTSLPDLSFPDYGDALLDSDFHSPAPSTLLAHPRTDLDSLTPWTSFPHDIHEAIQSATKRAKLPPAPFSIAHSPKTREVVNEEEIRCHATFELHEPAKDVSKMLGVEGRFILSGSGNVSIVGNPDFAWINRSEQSKVIVEYKSWWVADLMDLPAAFEGPCRDTLAQQSLEALHQIYGYMTFNNKKFGILTNWKRAWFLRRADSTSGRKTLEYYPLELGDQISMLKAWVGMVLLAEDDWFYESPTPDSAPLPRNFGHRVLPVDGEYECLPLDFRLCRFDLSFARHGAMCCVVNGRFPQSSVEEDDLHVVYKVVDVLRYPNMADILEDETRAYAALQNLQGRVIPMLYGFYEVWGILRILALEPVGNAIPEDEQIDQTLRGTMKAALRHIHDAGFVHGDIARRNFCRTDGGDVFLVDLERCRRAENPSELDNEMNEVDNL